MARRSPDNTGSYTDANINFGYGCRKVDPEGGCKNCYIGRSRWQKLQTGLANPFVGVFVPFSEEARLKDLDSLPDGSVVFINGQSDTFATDFISDRQRERWMGILEARPQFDFMVCTKRTGMMARYFSTRRVPENVWVGTSICRRKDLFRLRDLRLIEAAVRWVSFEPLLEDLGDGYDLSGVSFVCCGGETEPNGNYRPFDPEWGRGVLAKCRSSGAAFWYDGGNGRSDGRRGAPSPEHMPSGGFLPQERLRRIPARLTEVCEQSKRSQEEKPIDRGSWPTGTHAVLDMFSGSGYFSKAFEVAPWRILRVDSDPLFANLVPFTECIDVAALAAVVREGDFGVIVASPPCQEFSHMTKASRRRYDLPPPDPAKGMVLVNAALDIIRKVRPRVWVVENVGGSVQSITEAVGSPPRAEFAGRNLWSNVALDIHGDAGMYQKGFGGSGAGVPGAAVSYKASTILRSLIPFPVSAAVRRAAERETETAVITAIDEFTTVSG